MKAILLPRIATALVLGIAAFSIAPMIAQANGPKPAAPQTQSIKPADLSGTWSIDQSHTEVGFAVSHFGVSKTRGRFTDFGGTLTVDGAKPENSSVTVSIKVDSIDTGNKDRDNHLKSKDFFDAATYPEITFKSTKVQKKGKEYAATGNLTIHGVTKPVVLTFAPSTPVVGPGKKLRAGMETKLRIDRRDFDLKWNGVIEGTQAVGNDVDIYIDLEAVKQ